MSQRPLTSPFSLSPPFVNMPKPQGLGLAATTLGMGAPNQLGLGPLTTVLGLNAPSHQASRIGATSTTEDLEEQFTTLMQRMDDARSANPTIPDRHFTAAQKKIKGGDYDFDSVQKA